MHACTDFCLCRKLNCVHDVQVYGYETNDRLTTGRWTDDMLISFVGGVMNLAFMGLATFLMMIEKLPQYGRFLTMPLGLILILSGLNLFIF